MPKERVRINSRWQVVVVIGRALESWDLRNTRGQQVEKEQQINKSDWIWKLSVQLADSKEVIVRWVTWYYICVNKNYVIKSQWAHLQFSSGCKMCKMVSTCTEWLLYSSYKTATIAFSFLCMPFHLVNIMPLFKQECFIKQVPDRVWIELLSVWHFVLTKDYIVLINIITKEANGQRNCPWIKYNCLWLSNGHMETINPLLSKFGGSVFNLHWKVLYLDCHCENVIILNVRGENDKHKYMFTLHWKLALMFFLIIMLL